MAADLVAMLEKGAFSRAGSTCFIRIHYHGGAVPAIQKSSHGN